MTQVTYKITNDTIELDIEGHTGYINQENNNNDLCVAISTLTIMLVRYFEHIGEEVNVSDGSFSVKAENESDSKVIVEEVIRTLRWLESEYPSYLQVGAK